MELFERATPFTLILALYDADLALDSCGWEQMNRLQQCLLLQPNKINNKSSRRSLLNELINGSDCNYFEELTKKSYLRIRIKSVLSQFHKECVSLHSLTNVREWNGHQLLVTFIHHLIKMGIESDEKLKKAAGHAKVWQFVEYMRKYFGEENYNGTNFMAVFDDETKSKGFGLLLMRTICTKYGLKSGPYSKVKKQCNIWATNLYQQSKGNDKPNIKSSSDSNAKSNPKSKPKVNVKPNRDKRNNNYIGTVAKIVEEQEKERENKNNKNKDKNKDENINDYSGTYVDNGDIKDELYGKCWYWLCDYQGFKWIPYRQNDCEILNKGWRNKDKSAIIKSGGYRVEFNYSNMSEPCGNQFNNTIANPNGRIVKCETPKATIWSMNVQKNPM